MVDSPQVRDDPLRKFYPWLIASDLVILPCVAATGLVSPDRWNGTYLVWGLVFGILVVLLYVGMTTYVRRRFENAGNAHSAAKREQMRLRQRIVIPGCIAVGVAAGALSAIFDSPVVLLFFVAMMVLFFVIPWAIGIPLLLRRARGQQS